MDLLDWLGQILTCERSPEDLDLEALEDSLSLLDARAEENLSEYVENTKISLVGSAEPGAFWPNWPARDLSYSFIGGSGYYRMAHR